MNFHLVKPSGFLSPYIRHYCFMESEVGDAGIAERVIPVDSIQLMLHYKDPFVESHPDNSLVRQPRSFVSGLSGSWMDVSTSGEMGVVFVSFFPGKARHFFNFPLAEIENQRVGLHDIFHREIFELEEKLCLSNSIDKKVYVVEDFLKKKFCPAPVHDELFIQRFLETIKAHKGQIAPRDLADKLSVTCKTLERKSANYLGKTTKKYIQLIRFQELLTNISTGRYTHLTGLAYDSGYYDQAHFIHDFKRFCGYTPGAFVKKHSTSYIEADYH